MVNSPVASGGYSSSVYPRQRFGGELDHNDARNDLADADHWADIRLPDGSLCVPSHYLFVKGFSSMCLASMITLPVFMSLALSVLGVAL